MAKSKDAPVEKKVGVKKFHPSSLTKEQQEQVIEFYFGVHPQFLLVASNEIRIDIWNLEHAGKHFNGFFQNQMKLGISEEDIDKQRGKLGY